SPRPATRSSPCPDGSGRPGGSAPPGQGRAAPPPVVPAGGSARSRPFSTIPAGAHGPGPGRTLLRVRGRAGRRGSLPERTLLTGHTTHAGPPSAHTGPPAADHPHRATPSSPLRPRRSAPAGRRPGIRPAGARRRSVELGVALVEPGEVLVVGVQLRVAGAAGLRRDGVGPALGPAGGALVRAPPLDRQCDQHDQRGDLGEGPRDAAAQPLVRERGAAPRAPEPVEDRKSTRLNSSHVK